MRLIEFEGVAPVGLWAEAGRASRSLGREAPAVGASSGAMGSIGHDRRKQLGVGPFGLGVAVPLVPLGASTDRL